VAWEADSSNMVELAKDDPVPFSRSADRCPDGKFLALLPPWHCIWLVPLTTPPTKEELCHRRFMASIDYHGHKDQVDSQKQTNPFVAAFHQGWLVRLTPDDKTVAEFLAVGTQRRLTALKNFYQARVDAAAVPPVQFGPRLCPWQGPNPMAPRAYFAALEDAARRFAELE